MKSQPPQAKTREVSAVVNLGDEIPLFSTLPPSTLYIPLHRFSLCRLSESPLESLIAVHVLFLHGRPVCLSVCSLAFAVIEISVGSASENCSGVHKGCPNHKPTVFYYPQIK